MLLIVEECQILKTVKLGVPKVEKECLQEDRCGERQVILTVEVCVGFSMDLASVAKYVQSRFRDRALSIFAYCQAFCNGERGTRDHQEYVVNGVPQFRWKVQKPKVTLAVFAKSVKCC